MTLGGELYNKLVEDSWAILMSDLSKLLEIVDFHGREIKIANLTCRGLLIEIATRVIHIF